MPQIQNPHRIRMSIAFEEQETLLNKSSSSSSSSVVNCTVPHYGAEDTKCSQSTVPYRVGPLEINSTSRHGILAGIWLAQFLSALNLTLVPTMLPSISSEFNKSNEASWVGTSYLLATCTFTPLYGRLCNVMGRSAANQSAILFASIGILTCGLSNSMQMLIISRFISGMGGGGIFTTSAIITSDMYRMRSRGFVQSIGGIFYGLGMGLGGPVGGLITDWLGWRWAFLIQIPLFALSFGLATFNLHYVTPGTGRNTKDILRRIDYGGTLTLLGAVGSFLLFLSMRYSEGLPWSDYSVWAPFAASIAFSILFVLIEVYVAIEPVLPPYLLMQKVPVLVGCSNALVAVCNLSVTYYFPTWFQTVMLSSASTAGLHLLPNSICISSGSIFAGWMMRRTGQYKTINMIFGALPFFAAILMTQMKEDSHPALLWLSIMPLGFGNAVVLQTLFIALVSHLPESQMAVGTGFAQLLRGLGQVGGLASASAVFQSTLDSELHQRLPANSEELIRRIRHSARLISSLPPDIQRLVRDSYAASLKCVFILAAIASVLAYITRLPIPDKQLEDPDSTRPLIESDEDNSSISDHSSNIEEIRDDEDKIVRPRYRRV
ncbi:major facilitator superfamily domain-containing protein [Crassisporium funariophilum]|nr:major facilitator superfamily domain-containing protein [Crassisporium funariophilum]